MHWPPTILKSEIVGPLPLHLEWKSMPFHPSLEPLNRRYVTNAFSPMIDFKKAISLGSNAHFDSCRIYLDGFAGYG